MEAFTRPAVSLVVCATLLSGCVAGPATSIHGETLLCRNDVTVGRIYYDVRFDVHYNIHGPVISFSQCRGEYFASRIKMSTPLNALETNFIEDYDALALRESQALHSRGELEVEEDPDGVASFLLVVKSVVDYESVAR